MAILYIEIVEGVQCVAVLSRLLIQIYHIPQSCDIIRTATSLSERVWWIQTKV